MNPFSGHLAIVVGHTRQNPGAKGVAPIDVCEYEYNCALAELIRDLGKTRDQVVEIFLRDGVGISGAYQAVAEAEPDAVIELHFNAFNGSVSGTETLYSDKNDDKHVMELEFAQAIHDFICVALGRGVSGDRGLKDRPLSRGERGYSNVNQLFNLPSILVEPFFGDNKVDAELAVRSREKIAEAIIDGFEYWKSLVALERRLISAAEVLSGPHVRSLASSNRTPRPKTKGKEKAPAGKYGKKKAPRKRRSSTGKSKKK